MASAVENNLPHEHARRVSYLRKRFFVLKVWNLVFENGGPMLLANGSSSHSSNDFCGRQRHNPPRDKDLWASEGINQ